MQILGLDFRQSSWSQTDVKWLFALPGNQIHVLELSSLSTAPGAKISNKLLVLLSWASALTWSACLGGETMSGQHEKVIYIIYRA